jgi:serine protease Do
MNRFIGAIVGLTVVCQLLSAAEDRDAKVRNDRKDVLEIGTWIYNDLAKAIDEGKQTGKPLLVTVRCIPCVACQGFDARVLRYDPQIADLMQKFVCVRIVQANALDLSLFEHDYDLSFAAYFLNPDKTIYGRFGSRSDHKNAEKDISIEGFRKAMQGALELHAGYPANKSSLAAKRPAPPKYGVPEEYPSLKGKYTSSLNYTGKVAQSCIHCHQVREAERKVLRSAKQPIPDKSLYPWPMPDVIGLSLNAAEKAKIRAVAADSVAAKAGFQPGDEIVSLQEQPMLSIADVQWVLHNMDSPAIMTAEVRRDGDPLSLTLNLEKDWRRRSDISWRPTSWDLRRMVTGGLVLKDTTSDERQKLDLKETDLGLRVDYLGQYNEHAVGKKAGFQKNDVILSVDGKTSRMTESDVFAYLAQNRMPGERIPVTILRAGNKVEIQLPMQ